jgi:hypothetical protein
MLRRMAHVGSILCLALVACGSQVQEDSIATGGSVDGAPPDAATDTTTAAPQPDARQPDAPQPEVLAPVVADGLCTEPLEAFRAQPGMPGLCSASYDAAIERARSCAYAMSYLPPQTRMASGTCGDLQVVTIGAFWGAAACLYDGTGAAPLVGIWAINEGPAYCASAYSLAAGQVPTACRTDMHLRSAGIDNLQGFTCSLQDGGVDAEETGLPDASGD